MQIHLESVLQLKRTLLSAPMRPHWHSSIPRRCQDLSRSNLAAKPYLARYNVRCGNAMEEGVSNAQRVNVFALITSFRSRRVAGIPCETSSSFVRTAIFQRAIVCNRELGIGLSAARRAD